MHHKYNRKEGSKFEEQTFKEFDILATIEVFGFQCVLQH